METKTKFYAWVIYTCIFIFCSCCLMNPKSKADIEHVLKISNCDSLNSDMIFQRNNKIEWPERKPKSVVEAVVQLESMTNEFTKHLFRICEPSEFYFGFGMQLRNEWVYNGEPALKHQLFEKLKLSHSDHSSGIILGFYHLYLSQDTINIMDELGSDFEEDSMKVAKLEFLQIEQDLNNLKKSKSWF